MNKKDGKVFVWPICTRIIHWTIALSFTASFFSSLNKSYLHYHVAFGWIFGVMLIYRIVWGFFGPRYATFNTFKLNFIDLQWYFKEKVVNRWRKIPAGHNPASSWYTILVLFFGSLIVVSGAFLYGIQEGSGIFAFLNKEYYMYMIEFFDIHLYVSYFLFIWACIHIVGVMIEQFYHKTNMAFAMITGYKKAEGKDSDITPFGNIASYIFIIVSFVSFVYIVSTYDNMVTRSIFTPIDFEQEYKVYYTDCGNCHKTYPPYMLPSRSWKRIMKDLDNHFGEEITEANISKEARTSILTYLTNNSSEHSTNKVAFKLMNSLSKDEAPKAITKTDYWREIHKDIDPKIFKSKKVKSRAYCWSCHEGFENGIFRNDKISIPK
ncbi:MAG: cytochrome b/b6 domain-containing protein [Sulfurovaceae bacterium]|nr:cytochrome b/b6 domain-containing protein [Sulfurovaceae bacterium]MDD5548550.1 cytochrome b/b6 domain-containing protein [Sulfurovaceae bacterium]